LDVLSQIVQHNIRDLLVLELLMEMRGYLGNLMDLRVEHPFPLTSWVWEVRETIL
jgi:hypothetical protein